MTTKHLGALIKETAEKHGNRTAYRFKSSGGWHSVSYREFYNKIHSVARELLKSGCMPGDRVAIFSQNRPEWAIADFAIMTLGAVPVPIYATNTAAQAEYIIRDAETKLIFVETQEHYDKIKSIPGIAIKIVVFDENVTLDPEGAIPFKELLVHESSPEKDPEIDQRLRQARPADLASIIYTSGTTGEPKGVMLTHANFFHQMNAVDTHFNVGPNDVSLCFLPLSHVYERVWSFYLYSRGAQNNFLQNPKKVIEVMQEVKPTAMVSVPRLYEKIHAAIFNKLEKASFVRKKLFHWAVKTGRRYAEAKQKDAPVPFRLKTAHRLADKLVLFKVREIVGGPKNFFPAGGAPLSKEIEEFFFSTGLLICQGYGLTETAPMISFNTPDDFKFGTVGKPVPDCEVKIAENGEVLVRGGQVMKGYFGNPEATEKAIKNGWLHTGDIGEFDEEGYLRITDRIKDLIITSGGKNIAPQRIETLIGKDYYVEQIVVCGDRKKYVSALLVPAFESLKAYAREHNIDCASLHDLVNHPRIIDLYRKRIETCSKELANFETIKKFTLLSKPFSMEQGELTPTLKIRRKHIVEKYKKIINSMYAKD